MSTTPPPRVQPAPRADAVRLDITADACPMTWVKTKLEIEDLAPGALLEVRLREGESHHNVSVNVRDEGHAILADEPTGATPDGSIRRLTIRKAG